MVRRGRRGYPNAILIGFDKGKAQFWTIYSESMKASKVIERYEEDEKSSYRFHEEIIITIRGLLNEGFSGLIVASENKKQNASGFMEHVSKRHKWLMARLTVLQLNGKATTSAEVGQLIKTNHLQESITTTTEATVGKLLEQLERALDEGNILYTIEELQHALKANKKPLIIMMTEEFNQLNQRNRRFQSSIQISKNIGANVAVLKPTNYAFPRLNQIGGFACVISNYTRKKVYHFAVTRE